MNRTIKLSPDNIKTYYTISMVVIALIFIFSQLLINLLSNSKNNNDILINLCGKQRMLTQKITKSVLLIERSNSEDEKRKYSEELKKSILLLAKIHNALAHGDKDLSLKKDIMDAEMQGEFEKIIPMHKTFISTSLNLNNKEINKISFNKGLNYLLKIGPPYLDQLEALTNFITLKVNAKSNQVQIIIILSRLFILLILAFLTFFVFFPLMKKVGSHLTDVNSLNRDLVGSNQLLKKSHEEQAKVTAQLNDTVTKLTAILDSSTEVAIITTDLKGVINIFNVGAENLLGYKAWEVVGKYTPLKFHYEPEIERFLQNFQEPNLLNDDPERFFRLTYPKTSHKEECTYVTKKGALKSVSLTRSIMVNETNKAVGYLGIVFDISNQKHAEDKIKQSENLFRKLYNLLNGVFDISLSGIMVFTSVRDTGQNIIDFQWEWINKKAEELVNKRADELIGGNLLEIMPENREAGLFDLYVEVVETENILDHEHYYLIEGKKVWLHTVAVKFEDGFVVTFGDISERKNNEEIIKKNEANLTALIENTSDSIWSLDAEYNFVTLNSNFKNNLLQVTGRHYQVGDKLDFNNFPQQQVSEWKNFYAKALSGENFSVESIVQIGDADSYFEHSFNPVKNERGDIVGITIFGRDVTWRVEAGKEIREKSQMLAGVIANMPVIIFRINNKGILTNAMGEGLKLLGIKGDVTGLDAFKTFALFKKEIEEALDGKIKNFTGKIGFEKKRYFDIFFFPDEVNTDGVLGFALDITDKKEAEKAIKEYNEELHQLNDNKDKLFSIISHDLRSPLVGIIGSAELLVTYYDGLTKEERQQFAQNIYISSINLSKLLNNLLSWSNLQRNKFNFAPTFFGLNLLINDCIDLMKLNAEQKNINLSAKWPENILIWGDYDMLQSVIRNLISNALKFTSKGGYVNLFVEEEDKEFTISVSDTGHGMSKEVLSKIFKIDKVYTTKGTKGESGTGLGLILCKEFVEKHSGRIWAESKVGKGTTFFFTIPKKTVAMQP